MTRRLHLLSGLLARFAAGTARRRARRRQSAAVAAALSELNEYYLRDIGF